MTEFPDRWTNYTVNRLGHGEFNHKQYDGEPERSVAVQPRPDRLGLRWEAEFDAVGERRCREVGQAAEAPGGVREFGG